jgi:hypothetical protein
MNIRRAATVAAITAAVVIGMMAGGGGSLAAKAEDAPSWGPLQFLMGIWGAGENDKAETATYAFQPELQGHVLVRRCVTGCDSGPMGPGYSDILYVYGRGTGQGYRAIFFDSIGHVLQYEISTPTANSALFLSDGSTPGPRFRLSYTLSGGKMTGKFEMLPPGGGEARQLSEWSGSKK